MYNPIPILLYKDFFLNRYLLISSVSEEFVIPSLLTKEIKKQRNDTNNMQNPIYSGILYCAKTRLKTPNNDSEAVIIPVVIEIQPIRSDFDKLVWLSISSEKLSFSFITKYIAINMPPKAK